MDEESWRDRIRIGLMAAGIVAGVMLVVSLVSGAFAWGSMALVVGAVFVVFTFLGHQWFEILSEFFSGGKPTRRS